MQIKAVLLLVVIGAVAVLAKKGSSEEEGGVMPVLIYPNVDTQPMFIVSGAKGKKKGKGYPQGRPFQILQQLDGRYPQMTSFYPQQPGMQPFVQQGNQRPFGQNPFSDFSSMTSQQQYPDSFGNPTLGYSGSPRPFYAGSGRPNQFNGNNRPNQFNGNNRPNQLNGNARPNQFPGNPQISASAQFPNNGLPSFSAEFPGSTFPLTS